MNAAARVSDVLGVEEPDTEIDFVDLIRTGLPYRAVEQLREEMGLSLGELAEALSISTRTLNRRKQSESLNSEESDRVFRIARVYAHALAVLESSERAANWFKKSNRALGGRIPLEMFDTDVGAEMVDDVLTRIEYGVYT